MKLTAQHHQAINLMLTGNSGKDIAENLNVTQETISRWRSDFNFQAELNTLLRENQTASRERLHHLATIAFKTLEGVMTNTDTAPKDKLTASIKVLELMSIKPYLIGNTKASALKAIKEKDDFFDSI